MVIYLLPLIANLSTFLVYPAIVFPVWKALDGLVYKPAHVSLSLSLASSMHHLHSNLVFPLSSSLDLSLTGFLSSCGSERRMMQLAIDEDRRCRSRVRA